MTYVLRKHKVEGMKFMASPNNSPNLRPRGIIVHDTASRLTPLNAAEYLCTRAARASAHFVCEMDGTMRQLVRLNRQAWHAGPSRFQGVPDCNDFMFGIEIVNPGLMERTANGNGRAWYGQVFDREEWDLQEISTPEHGTGMWMPYQEAQLENVFAMCQALWERYRLDALTTHWAVSPGRKVDTNPLFPLASFRGRLRGRKSPVRTDQNDATALVACNVRRWPSYNDNIITVLPKLQRCDVLRSGVFPSGDCSTEERWHLVDLGEQQGWVNANLIDLDD